MNVSYVCIISTVVLEGRDQQENYGFPNFTLLATILKQAFAT